MTLEHLYTDTGDIQRATTVAAATGSVRETWSVVSSGVVCEVQPINQNYVLSEKGFIRKASHRGFFELSTDIQRGDRFELNSIYPPQLFDVLAVMEVRWHHFEVQLDEVHEEDGTPTPGAS